MKTRNEQLHHKSDVNNTFGSNFKIILFGAILLMAGICNSCNPDDDTTDGTSGATSQLLIHHEFHSTISEQLIWMS